MSNVFLMALMALGALKTLGPLMSLFYPLLLTGIFFNTRAEFSIFNFQFSIFNSLPALGYFLFA